MDAIRNFVKGQSNIEQQVDHVYRLLLEVGRQDFVWDLGVIKTSIIILSMVSHRPVLGEAKMEDHQRRNQKISSYTHQGQKRLNLHLKMTKTP